MSVSLVKITPATVVYIVGHNTAGYMPESDTAAFADIESARIYLADELDQLADYLGDVESDGGPEDGEDFALSNYALAVAELVKRDTDDDVTAWVNRGGWTTYIDTGRSIDTAYWIHATTLGEVYPDGDDNTEEWLDLMDALRSR